MTPRTPRLTDPVVTYNAKTCAWTVERDYRCRSNGFALVVPKGRVSDLASIPRWLWWLIASFELSLGAALVHDEGYRHGGMIRSPNGLLQMFSRAEVDRFLYDLAAQDGVWWWRRYFAYKAVRWFGKRAWQIPTAPQRASA